MALGLVAGWLIIAVPLFWANDALGYLAAGERLNAGHALYALSAGDRLVEISPPYWSYPFLYPPLWGIVWRPIAMFGNVGIALWMSVVAVAMLWFVWRTSERAGWPVAALSASFGVLLASGNVAGLLMIGMAFVPALRPRNAGVLVGVMGAVKVMPAMLIVWFLATRRYRAAAWAIATGALLTGLAYLYDPALTWQYVHEVVPTTKAIGIAPAALLGLPWWTSWAILVAGLVVVWLHRSYAAAVVAVVLGSPAIGIAGLAQLLPIARRK